MQGSGGGGALYLKLVRSLTVISSSFSNSTSGTGGGALSLQYVATLTVTACSFLGSNAGSVSVDGFNYLKVFFFTSSYV